MQDLPIESQKIYKFGLPDKPQDLPRIRTAALET